MNCGEDDYDLDTTELLISPDDPDPTPKVWGWRQPDRSFSKSVRGWPGPIDSGGLRNFAERIARARQMLIAGCGEDAASTLFVPIWRRCTAHNWEQIPEAYVLLNAGDKAELVHRTEDMCGEKWKCNDGLPRVVLTNFLDRRAQPAIRTRDGKTKTLIRFLRDLPDLASVHPRHRRDSQRRLGFHYLAHTPLVLYRSCVVPMAFKFGAKATRNTAVLYWAQEYHGAIEAMNASPLPSLGAGRLRAVSTL